MCSSGAGAGRCPHSLHVLLWRWRGQMSEPPHSLHVLLIRACGQMPAPPHSLHLLLWRWCCHRPAPPHSVDVLLRRWCGQSLCGCLCAGPASSSPWRGRLPPADSRLRPPAASVPGLTTARPPPPPRGRHPSATAQPPTGSKRSQHKRGNRPWHSRARGRSVVMIEHDAAGVLTEGLGSIQSDVSIATEMILELSEV